jgi:hypothetical protein
MCSGALCLVGLDTLLALLLYGKGVGFTRKIRVNYNLSDHDSISTYQFYKIYL